MSRFALNVSVFVQMRIPCLKIDLYDNENTTVCACMHLSWTYTLYSLKDPTRFKKIFIHCSGTVTLPIGTTKKYFFSNLENRGHFCLYCYFLLVVIKTHNFENFWIFLQWRALINGDDPKIQISCVLNDFWQRYSISDTFQNGY